MWLPTYFISAFWASCVLLPVFTVAKESPSEGCSAPFKFPTNPGDPSKPLKVGNRVVRVALPKNYKHGVPAPLVLAYHDRNQGAVDFEELSLLSDPSFNPDSIVVYPQAIKEYKWMSDPHPPSRVNDLTFTGTILDKISSRLCVDLDRVYAAGLGTGGGLVHLIACNEKLSNRFAAYSVINGAVFKSSSSMLGVKDEFSLVWDNCSPSRFPSRIQIIHSENNTDYDFWGRKRAANRKLVPCVQWLVQWSMENKCGPAMESPSLWKDETFKTPLQSGVILEGPIENGRVMKASYHCWHNDQEDLQKSVEDVIAKIDLDAPYEKKKASKTTDEKPSVPTEEPIIGTKETKETKEKEGAEAVVEEDDYDRRLAKEEAELQERTILQNFLIRDTPHGWPRIQLNSIDNELTDELAFDTTAQVLGWFGQHRLSDEQPTPPEYLKMTYGINENRLEQLVRDIDKQLKEEEQKEWKPEGNKEKSDSKKGSNDKTKVNAGKEEPHSEHPNKKDEL